MTERTPLLNYRLLSSVNESEPRGAAASQAPEQLPDSPRRRSSPQQQPKKLSVFFGVVVPTLLSMFSVVLFLRIGFVVGHAGLYQSIVMFLVAYFIISMTVLSVCAISTNGALDAGGAYYMISRALGPEFGGSIGLMFFLANVCGSALYVLGLVEAIVSTFGIPEDPNVVPSAHQVLPSGYWWSLLYATGVALVCLLVCLVGAHIYAKATFIIFLVVIFVLIMIFISFFVVGAKTITLPSPSSSNPPNGTGPVLPTTANFTGFKLETLLGNLYAGYTSDYTTGKMMSFATVFAVMFNGCTGIMAGSNMSGDLKNPSYSIPRGTVTAVIFTFIIYNLLSLLVACSCDRVLLQRDYSFLRAINIWDPFVIIGVYSSTLSAAMSNLIGASRILYALARDDLFGKVLSLAKRTSHSGNPWVSVLMSWFLVQLVLFSGKLNTIASIVTIFFLLVYAAVDLACLALEWASAPNFRYTYRTDTHTHRHTICFFCCFFYTLTFYICLWGRLLKDHIKFWRPQILLMVSNPRSSVGLITFINDIKKSGLYVLGHVQLGDLSTLPSDPLQAQYDSWLSLVDHLNIKAFVNLTLADSVRHGVQHLLFISGLGGMRPNTLVLGFYDDCLPKDKLIESPLFSTESVEPFSPSGDVDQPPMYHFASLRGSSDRHDYGEFGDGKVLGPQEYVSVISDAMKMLKNVILARYFNDFDRAQVLSSPSPLAKGDVFVDVWPINLLRPDSCSYVDTCSLFLLQLACILNMVKAWRKATLRLFLCVEEGQSVRGSEAKLGQLLKDLRIKAQVYPVPWDQVVGLHWQRQGGFSKNQKFLSPDSTTDEMEARPMEEESEDDYVNSFPSNATRVSDDYLTAVNKLILDQASQPPAVRFLYLPRPPADTRRYATYLHQLDLLTQDLGPTLLIHGVTPVITTDL
uniref:Solute carrier family 12 member 9 n=1 Tax=Fundulus heteroclitus TaxID=8078 RepID=A0A3Q2UPI3_FUNHE